MYQIHTTKAADLAEFFSGPESDLAANGLSMTADGDRLLFGEDVLAHLREHRSADQDGYVTELTIWIGGDGYEVETAN